MAQLALECPHCRAEKIGFAYRSHHQVSPGSPHTLLFLQCEGCGQGLVAVIHSHPAGVQHWVIGNAASPGAVERVYPEPTALRSPADVPPSVQRAYLSGLDNLGRKGGTNAAAIMFRRSIEIAAKIINPDLPKSYNLDKRIESLPPDIATPAMKEWAHHVRLDANEAAHELEEFSDADAKQLHVFAEMFLTYAFTLPAMLKRAKEQPAPAGAKGG